MLLSRRCEFESRAVVFRRPIECQRCISFLRRQDRIARGFRGFARLSEVFEQRLGVVCSSATSVRAIRRCNCRPAFARHRRGDGFADSIVVQLHTSCGTAAAEELGGAEPREERSLVAVETCCLVHHFRVHRPSADRQRLDEPLRARRQAAQAVLHHLRKGRWIPAQVVRGEIACQLAQQERIAMCFVRDVRATSRR